MSNPNLTSIQFDESIALINACYALTKEYSTILAELGKANDLTENEMQVLIHLAMYPEACTQKKLQATNLNLSVSSVCRMVESLRKKGYISTELDVNDRRSWILHMEEPGALLAEDFRQQIHDRMEELLKKQNILSMYACIAYTEVEDQYLVNHSKRFHTHMGYELTATFPKCGYKFDKWYDIIWMHKEIGHHGDNPAPIIPITELDDSILH